VTAVILAAGYATRLYPLTLQAPKCLLRVGGRPLLDWLCEKIEGVPDLEELVIVTNAKFHTEIEAWNETADFSFPVRVLNDGTESNEARLGAIGDLNFAITRCRMQSDILLLASDNLFDASLKDFVHFGKLKNGAPVLGLYDIGEPQAASKKFGVAQINASQEIVDLEEKPAEPKTSLIATGVYYFPKGTLHFVSEYLSDKDAKDAPGHFLRWLLGRMKIFGFVFLGLWYDIGDLNAFQEADKIFSARGGSAPGGNERQASL